MENKNAVKGLLLIGPDRYTVPGLALLGLVGIVGLAGYGVYALGKRVATKTKNIIHGLKTES